MEEQERIILTDDEGNEVPFDILDEIELDDQLYLVLTEADIPWDEMDDEEEGPEVLIFRCEEDEDGEETISPVEDEDLQQYIFDLYQANDEDYEFGEAT